MGLSSLLQFSPVSLVWKLGPQPSSSRPRISLLETLLIIQLELLQADPSYYSQNSSIPCLSNHVFDSPEHESSACVIVCFVSLTRRSPVLECRVFKFRLVLALLLLIYLHKLYWPLRGWYGGLLDLKRPP
jgi:hypothetical protein